MTIRKTLIALGLAAVLPAAAHAEVDAAAMQALATKHLCLACHKIDGKLVGPSYKEVAAKYKGDATAAAKLFERVKKGGGKNVWGSAAVMPPAGPPNAPPTDAQLKSLIEWVLSQAK